MPERLAAPRRITTAPLAAALAALVAALVVVLGVSAALVIGPTAAFAHANLLAASPAPGQVAGGTLDRVQLVFDEAITEFDATIEGPNSTALVIDTIEIGPQQIELRFDPLRVEGDYAVRYRFTSADDDRVELGFGFEFDAGAPAVLPLSGPSIVSSSSSGPSPLAWVAIAIAAVAVAALAVLVARRRRLLLELRSAR